VAGDLDIESLEHLDDQAVIERLTSLRGVGRWIAEYVMLRGLGRLHIFPGGMTSAPATSWSAFSLSKANWTTRV
jgi:DNA-3-methyladenine glycosylase II